jgi:hypothetical protein
MENKIINKYYSDKSTADTPWYFLEERVSWNEILENHGWKEKNTNRWIRPGKTDDGISATTNYDGLPIFTCFSTNAYPFEADKSYGKFQVYSLLNYNGDNKLAVKEFSNKFPEFNQYKSNNISSTYALDKYKPLFWNDINSIEFPETEWWVNKLIPKMSFVILASVSGEGKTWTSYTLAKNLSEGSNFLDKEEFKTEKCTVLYIDAENSKKVIQKRGRKLEIINNDNLLIMPVSDLNLNDKNVVSKILEIIDTHKVNVVIIDTFRAVAGGLNENEANTIRQFFNRFKETRDKGTTFVFLDHYRKPSRMEGNIPKKEFLFGSQDKVSGVDGVLMLKKEGDFISTYQVKSREEKEINPFKMELRDTKHEDGKETTKLFYIGEISEEDTLRIEIKSVVVNVLTERPNLSKRELLEFILLQKKVSPRTLDSALKELREEGEISVGKRGRQNIYFLKKVDDSVSTESDLGETLSF